MNTYTSGANSGSKLSIEAVTKVYETSGGVEVTALSTTDLEVREHEVVCLMGPSGCGKSTLLNIVAGLLEPSSGTVRMDGRTIEGPGPDRAMVFQSDAVFPWMTVQRNISYPARIAGKSAREQAEIAERFISMVGLTGFENSWPKELSGGMRKRVDVARAYAAYPSAMLMDEPFGALDVMTKEALQVELEALLAEEPKTVLFVTHDLEEALFMGDRVALMSPRPGRVVRIEDVPFPRPRSLDVKTTDEFVGLRRRIMASLADIWPETTHQPVH